MDRPILFSGPMVRAILEGRKTQTRRACKLQPIDVDVAPKFTPNTWGFWRGDYPDHGRVVRCPYGDPGDTLWVRETWAWPGEEEVLYRASHQHLYDKMRTDPLYPQWKWKPSIHMPRWASRITLEIESIRVERLQDISEEDAKAEGIRSWTKDGALYKFGVVEPGEPGSLPWSEMPRTAREAFGTLWRSINGPESWDANPWVWVLGFKRAEQKAVAHG